jgi:hypothetical protein
MKKSSRSFLILSLITLALLTSRCECTRSDNSSGRCEGAIGGLLLSEEIDRKSWYTVDYTRGVDIYDFSFGSGKLHISAEVSRATVLSGGAVLNVRDEVGGGGAGGADGGPGGADGGAEGTDGGTDGGTGGISPASPEIKSFRILAPTSRPRLREGTLERSLTFVELRLSSTLRMIFEDGTSLVCNFELARDEDKEIGKEPSKEGGGCLGGGGGGDSDFD